MGFSRVVREGCLEEEGMSFSFADMQEMVGVCSDGSYNMGTGVEGR